MKNVIITDVKYRMAISPIRELSKKGYKITAADFENVAFQERICEYSKYVNEKNTISEEKDAFKNDIISLCKEERKVLLPVNRKSLVNVISSKDELEKYCDFLVPSLEAINLADDKNIMHKMAQKLDVPTPLTTSLEEHNSIEEMSEKVQFPCIIKFRNGEAMGLKPHDRYKIVNSKDEFIKAYNLMNDMDKNPIASSYISGHDIGVAVIMDKNQKAVDFICYESFREYPIEGGPTCFLKTIFNRDLLKYACKLLEEIKFTGVAMLDFKGRIDEPYFLEINPRVWGSAAITEISKSTFFESYVKAAMGSTKALDLDMCMPTYKVGAKMRFTPQSFACFLSHMKKSKGKLKIFGEYFKSFFDLSVRDGLFSIKDPIPYFKYLQNIIKR